MIARLFPWKWIVGDGGKLIPSRCREVRQIMRCENELAIETGFEQDGLGLVIHAQMHRGANDAPSLKIVYKAVCSRPATLCVALRPYNPEGIQFIDSIKGIDETPGWWVNRKTPVFLDREPVRYVASTYREGDVFNRLDVAASERTKNCPVGMGTAAALFPLEGNGPDRVSVRVPLDTRPGLLSVGTGKRRPRTSWKSLDALSPVLDIPDDRMKYLYQTATRTLLSLTAGEVYPGSYTYRRFWFRDACIMLNALLTLNHSECCGRAFETSFSSRQTVAGFFQSQEGEWDSIGRIFSQASRAFQGIVAEARSRLRRASGWMPGRWGRSRRTTR